MVAVQILEIARRRGADGRWETLEVPIALAELAEGVDPDTLAARLRSGLGIKVRELEGAAAAEPSGPRGKRGRKAPDH